MLFSFDNYGSSFPFLANIYEPFYFPYYPVGVNSIDSSPDFQDVDVTSAFNISVSG